MDYLNNFKKSVKNELLNHIIDKIKDGILTNENKEEWHFYCFNEDYYIIYHYKCVDWLKNHEIDVFEAIDIVKEYENDNFGEFTRDINPESIVNMFVYILGEEILNSFDVENVKQLKKALKNELN